jgi:hypothetical protein
MIETNERTNGEEDDFLDPQSLWNEAGAIPDTLSMNKSRWWRRRLPFLPSIIPHPIWAPRANGVAAFESLFF